MADKNAESLCRLMDGELDETKARFLIRRLGHDRELRARWERYHLVRSTVRRQLRVNLKDFAGRVAALVDSEARAAGPPIRGRLGWLKPLGGAAVAASVAALAFSLWQRPEVEVDPLQPTADALVAAAEPRAVIGPRATPASAVQAPAAWNSRLQGYLIRHNEATGPRAGQGLVPYWTLVSEPISRTASDDEAPSEEPAAAD